MDDNKSIKPNVGYFLIDERNMDKLGTMIAKKAALADTSAIEDFQCKALFDACEKLGILNSVEYDKKDAVKSFTLCDFDHRYEVRR